MKGVLIYFDMWVFGIVETSDTISFYFNSNSTPDATYSGKTAQFSCATNTWTIDETYSFNNNNMYSLYTNWILRGCKSSIQTCDYKSHTQPSLFLKWQSNWIGSYKVWTMGRLRMQPVINYGNVTQLPVQWLKFALFNFALCVCL